PLLRSFGVREVRELDWWEATDLGPCQVAATPAQHFSARSPLDRNRSLWCGFAVRSTRWRVYFAGDTGYHPEFRAIGQRHGPFDLALIPIGAYDPRWFMRPVHLSTPRRRCGWRSISGRRTRRIGVPRSFPYTGALSSSLMSRWTSRPAGLSRPGAGRGLIGTGSGYSSMARRGH
ncbi:MAG: MBL fold metallo-hydrolase, partial [Gemmatimonadales bacterium]